ncbi:MAG: hypothetical protein M1827_004953 [Pycnora praestabilis]|nr:MAG: hypothetical protein M1827_004953 [Pycnora praestabilis]
MAIEPRIQRPDIMLGINNFTDPAIANANLLAGCPTNFPHEIDLEKHLGPEQAALPNAIGSCDWKQGLICASILAACGTECVATIITYVNHRQSELCEMIKC